MPKAAGRDPDGLHFCLARDTGTHGEVPMTSPTTKSIRKSKRDTGGDTAPLGPIARQHKPALDANPIIAEHAEAIRSLGKRVVADVIEIGRRLTECKKLLGHGNWLPWLNREFGWSEDTALNFMRVDGFAKSRKFRDLNLPVSSLYLLAAPSTSPEVRDEIIERAGSGEKVPHSQVVERVRQAKPKSKPPAAEHREQHGGPPPMYVLDCEKAAAVPDRRAEHTVVNGEPWPSPDQEPETRKGGTPAHEVAATMIALSSATKVCLPAGLINAIGRHEVELILGAKQVEDLADWLNQFAKNYRKYTAEQNRKAKDRADDEAAS